MQKIFDHCYDLDRRCYETFKLTEDILMEHAADAMARHIRERFAPGKRIVIVAGPGNNGADGITLARLLHADYAVSLHLPYGAKSTMAKLQLERTLTLDVAVHEEMPKDADIVVDAVFGAGLSKPLDEKGIAWVERMNALPGYKLACDIPTGLNDRGAPLPVAFRADATVTMGALKTALFGDAAKRYVGAVEVADLGLSRAIYEGKTNTFLLEEEDFRPPLRHDPAAHKGDFGHLCVVAGEKTGAAILAGSAGLRIGAGLVTLLCERELPTLPHSLMRSDSLPGNTTALALGMGLGEGFDPSALALGEMPLLLDADACDRPWTASLLRRGRVVVTPHPKEFARLLARVGIAEVDAAQIQRDRFGWARRFAEAYPDAVLLLKGANTLIAHGETLHVNPLGTPVLSQAGSGDVLAGIIGGLLAQGVPPLEAAVQGSLALALAARRYEGADYSATAEDLIEGLRWLA